MEILHGSYFFPKEAISVTRLSQTYNPFYKITRYLLRIKVNLFIFIKLMKYIVYLVICRGSIALLRKLGANLAKSLTNSYHDLMRLRTITSFLNPPKQITTVSCYFLKSFSYANGAPVHRLSNRPPTHLPTIPYCSESDVFQHPTHNLDRLN